jgi:hypothetical protein
MAMGLPHSLAIGTADIEGGAEWRGADDRIRRGVVVTTCHNIRISGGADRIDHIISCMGSFTVRVPLSLPVYCMNFTPVFHKRLDSLHF